jgi:hypothetical protein
MLAVQRAFRHRKRMSESVRQSMIKIESLNGSKVSLAANAMSRWSPYSGSPQVHRLESTLRRNTFPEGKA